MRDFLQELAVAAAGEFPSASCGISVVRRGALVPVAVSDARAHALETSIDETPQHAAVHTRQPVHVPDVSVDLRWPTFRELALRISVCSVLALHVDVDVDDVTVGVLTSSSSQTHVFEAADRQHRAARLVDEAHRALTFATRLARTERTSWQLEEALVTRATIDQAIGIVMAQSRCSAEDAFDVLRRASQNRNQKLRTVAAEIVTHVGGPPG